MAPGERLAAKRADEGTRALTDIFDRPSVGILIAGFLAPPAAGHPEPGWAAFALLATGAHPCAQGVLRRLLQPEE